MKQYRSQYKQKTKLTGRFLVDSELSRQYETYKEEWLARFKKGEDRWVDLAAEILAGLDYATYKSYKDRGSNYYDNLPKSDPLVWLDTLSEFTLHDRAIIFEIATLLWAGAEKNLAKLMSKYDFNSADTSRKETGQTIGVIVFLSTLEKFWKKKGQDKKSIRTRYKKGLKIVEKENLKEWLKYEGGSVHPLWE